MIVRVYEYAKCSTCRQALKFLEARGVAFVKTSIVEQPPSLAELKAMLVYAGDLRRLFNTSGVIYREMRLGEKLEKMSENEALTLLSKHGKLVKRPFVLLQDRGLLGFKEEEWKAAFRS